MIVVFKVFGLVVLWLAFNDAVQLGLSMYWGIDPEYATSIVLTGSIAVSVKFVAAALLIVATEKVVALIGIDPQKGSYGSERAFALGAASLVGFFFLVQGLTLSISKYTIARMQFSEINSQGVNLFTTSLYDWDWQSFLYGVVQSSLGLTLIVAVFAYNKAMHATSA